MQSSSANDQSSSQAIQAKLEEYKKIASQGTLNPEQQKDFDALVTKLERISEEGQLTPKVSLDIPSSQTKLNGQHRETEPLLTAHARASEAKKPKSDVIITVQRSSSGRALDLKDGDIKTNGARENIKQPLLDNGARSEQKEVARAFEYIYRGDYDGLSEYLKTGSYQSLAKPAATGPTSDDFVIATEQDSPYKKLPKKEQIQILMEYISRNPTLYKWIRRHGRGGLFGEILYLIWDCIVRKKTTEWYIEGIDPSVNWTVNILLSLLFVGPANFAFSPEEEAKEILEATMLDPKKSLKNLIKNNKLLTGAFGLFAVGGSYIEVEQIYEVLGYIFGPLRPVAIAAIIYMGTSYYGLFNFKDVIENFENRDKFPILNIDPPGWDEWLNKGFVELHKLLTNLERCARIGYGGFKAGQQTFDSDIAGYISMAIMGAATYPVALYTRARATHKIYYPKDVSAVDYAKMKLSFEVNARSSWKNRICTELSLAWSPTLLLQAPSIYFVTKFVASFFPENSPERILCQTVAPIVTALGCHSIFRHPTKRARIAKQCLEEQAAKADKTETIANQPNKKAIVLSYAANFVDQFSRTMTFGFSLHGLGDVGASIFNVETSSGREMMGLAACLSGFIAVSAFRYQVEKTHKAFPSLVPRLFAKKSVLDNTFDEPSTGNYQPPSSARSVIDSPEIEPTKVHLVPGGSINS